MNNRVLKLLNPPLFLAFLCVAASMLLYKMPGRFQYSELLYGIHTYAGTAFILIAIVHITLNWKWIKSQIFGIKAKKK